VVCGVGLFSHYLHYQQSVMLFFSLSPQVTVFCAQLKVKSYNHALFSVFFCAKLFEIRFFWHILKRNLLGIIVKPSPTIENYGWFSDRTQPPKQNPVLREVTYILHQGLKPGFLRTAEGRNLDLS